MYCIPQKNKQRAFTLIELLVVVFIVGILARVVVISIGDGGRDRLVKDEARRLSGLLTLAQEQAIMISKEFGVLFDQEFSQNNRYYYRFMVLEDQGWQSLAQDALFKQHFLPQGLKLVLDVEGIEVDLQGNAASHGSAGNKDRDSNKDKDDDSEANDDNEQQEQYQPDVYLLSSGELTPFTIIMSVLDDQDAPYYQVTGDIIGNIEMEGPINVF